MAALLYIVCSKSKDRIDKRGREVERENEYYVSPSHNVCVTSYKRVYDWFLVTAPNFWLHIQKTVNHRKAVDLLSLRHGAPSRCDAGGGLQVRKWDANMLNKQSRTGKMCEWRLTCRMLWGAYIFNGIFGTTWKTECWRGQEHNMKTDVTHGTRKRTGLILLRMQSMDMVWYHDILTHTFERANKRNISKYWRKTRTQISNMVQESG